MQLKQIDRDALLKPLQAVSGIVERRHTLPILANVLLEPRDGRLYITATDLEMQITAVAEVAGKDGQATTVAARKLQDLLRALPDSSTLNVDTTGNRMTVRAGRSRFNLQTMAAGDYPRISLGTEQLQTLSLPQKDLRALIKRAEFAMAQQDIRYYLNGMLLVIDGATLQAVATDGHRLSWASLEVAGSYSRQEVILPRKTVIELGKLLAESDDPVTLDILANQVRFRFGNVELVSKVVDGKFPDYNRVIPIGHGKVLDLKRQELLAALQRAAILSNEKFRGVRLVLTAGTLKIICTNAEQEEAEEELEVPYSGDGLDIGFNVTYLLDVLGNLASDRINLAFGDANSSALVTMPDRDDYKYVVMPMRI
ncbi:MAG TPA: DNA polymerase III subunit beta [Casimicrobiaceae bacterium]|nr:DNA polymerase III subunit beta [Casimicrobiaceae bacterium]